MKNIISAIGLTKKFKTHHRQNEGLLSSFRSLYKREYKEITAVNNINFAVKEGTIHGLIGSNGSGKSTTIKMLSGILLPTQGTIHVMGMCPWKNRTDYVKHIGVVLGQKGQLNWELPALDTYTLQKHIYKIDEYSFRQNLEYYIDVFNIHDIVRKPVRTLSLGERMKCEFLCSLLHEPKLIFLDEPTIGLDVPSKDTIRQIIKKINREKGITFILTTHDLDDVENLCKEVTIMNRGHIIFNDSFEKLNNHFSQKKTVRLKFLEPITKKQLNGFAIQLSDACTGVIDIDPQKTDMGLQVKSMIEHLPIKDIDIKPMDLETIVREIYSQSN